MRWDGEGMAFKAAPSKIIQFPCTVQLYFLSVWAYSRQTCFNDNWTRLEIGVGPCQSWLGSGSIVGQFLCIFCIRYKYVGLYLFKQRIHNRFFNASHSVDSANLLANLRKKGRKECSGYANIFKKICNDLITGHALSIILGINPEEKRKKKFQIPHERKKTHTHAHRD